MEKMPPLAHARREHEQEQLTSLRRALHGLRAGLAALGRLHRELRHQLRAHARSLAPPCRGGPRTAPPAWPLPGPPAGLKGREAELRQVLSYVCAGENRISLLSGGSGGGVSGDGGSADLGSFVLSLPSVARAVQGFLADRALPVLILDGEAGCGKSTVLREVARHLEARPGLRVLLHTGDSRSLHRRIAADEGLADQEWLLSPAVVGAGRSRAGLVLLLDGMELGPWLPMPLPAGVRCVLVPARSAEPCWPADTVRVIRLPPLSTEAAAPLQEGLGLAGEAADFPAALNPLWLALAARRNEGGSGQQMRRVENGGDASAAALASGGDGLTKEQAMELQRELHGGFASAAFQAKLAALAVQHGVASDSDRGKRSMGFAQERQEMLLTVQRQILPRFGFEGNLSGVYRMMGALTPFIQDADFVELACRINALIGIDKPPETWGALCQKMDSAPLQSPRRAPEWAELLPRELPDMVQAVLMDTEELIGGPAVVGSLCALALSRAGLRAAEVAQLLETHLPEQVHAWPAISDQLEPLLRFGTSGLVELSPLLLVQVDRRYFQPAPERRPLWHRRLGEFFATASADRRCEAARHYAALKDRQRLLATITDWPVFWELDQHRRQELCGYCRTAGGYPVVRKALLQNVSTLGPDAVERLRTVGAFLSHIGEFAAAREWLQAAKRASIASGDELELARGLSAAAGNEIRCWDAHPDRRNPCSLTDLLSAALRATELFASFVDRRPRRAEQTLALLHWASGCVRAALACEFHEDAMAYIGMVDAAVEQAQLLLLGCPPSWYLGRLLLVQGEAQVVIGIFARRATLASRRFFASAIDFFELAEQVLAAAAGDVNEWSMYAHASRADIFLHSVFQVPAGMVHSIKCCKVGVSLWGPSHPNVARYLQDFCAVLHGLGLSAYAEHIGRGTMYAMELLDTLLNIFNQDHELSGFSLAAWAAAEGPEPDLGPPLRPVERPLLGAPRPTAFAAAPRADAGRLAAALGRGGEAAEAADSAGEWEAADSAGEWEEQ